MGSRRGCTIRANPAPIGYSNPPVFISRTFNAISSLVMAAPISGCFPIFSCNAVSRSRALVTWAATWAESGSGPCGFGVSIRVHSPLALNCGTNSRYSTPAEPTQGPLKQIKPLLHRSHHRQSSSVELEQIEIEADAEDAKIPSGNVRLVGFRSPDDPITRSNIRSVYQLTRAAADRSDIGEDFRRIEHSGAPRVFRSCQRCGE